MSKEDFGKMGGHNRKRMYPGTRNRLRPDNCDFRRKEAKGRLEAFSALTIDQKIKVLDGRLGAGVGAVRQRARYAKALESTKQRQKLDQEAAMKATDAKTKTSK